MVLKNTPYGDGLNGLILDLELLGINYSELLLTKTVKMLPIWEIEL